MAIGPKDHQKRRQVQQDALAATKATDAAVRRALVESRQGVLLDLTALLVIFRSDRHD